MSIFRVFSGILAAACVAAQPAIVQAVDAGAADSAALLERLRGDAEYVLFDAPPVVAVTDAAVLAPAVDGVLLVLKAGKSKRDLAQRAKEQLEKVNAHILGVVLTNAPTDGGGAGYYGSPSPPNA